MVQVTGLTQLCSFIYHGMVVGLALVLVNMAITAQKPVKTPKSVESRILYKISAQIAPPEQVPPKQQVDLTKKSVSQPAIKKPKAVPAPAPTEAVELEEPVLELEDNSVREFSGELPHLSKKQFTKEEAFEANLQAVTPDMLPTVQEGKPEVPPREQWPMLAKGETLVGYLVDHEGLVVETRVLASANENLTEELLLAYAGKGLKFKNAGTTLQENQFEWIMQIYRIH